MTLHRLCPTCGHKQPQSGNCGCRDRNRGTTTQRGYGTHHQRKRQSYQRMLEHGYPIHCARCDKPIHPTDEWALDHTNNRTGYLGPSHRHCNEREAGHHSGFLRKKNSDPLPGIREKYEERSPSVG